MAPLCSFSSLCNMEALWGQGCVSPYPSSWEHTVGLQRRFLKKWMSAFLPCPALSELRDSARKGVRLWPSRLLADSVLQGFLQSNSFLQSSMSSTCCQSLTHLSSPVPPWFVLEWLPIPNTCNLWLWGLSLAAKVQRWASCDEAKGVNSLALPDFCTAR